MDRAAPELHPGLISEGQLLFNLRSAPSILGIPTEQAAFPAAMGSTGLYHWQRQACWVALGDIIDEAS